MSSKTGESRILMVDDDADFFGLMRDYLQPRGFLLEAARTGADGVDKIKNNDYDAIILDVMMPGVDGFEVLKQIRQFSIVPVLMLTALGDEADRIIGLEAGADDYLPKTFSPRELLARLRAAIRRSRLVSADGKTDAERIFIKDLYVNSATREAAKNGEPLALTSLEFDLLLLLVRFAGEILTRDRLLDEIAGRNFNVFDRSIDVHIWSLRRKLDDDFKDPRYIRTVRSAGYMFVPEDAGDE